MIHRRNRPGAKAATGSALILRMRPRIDDGESLQGGGGYDGEVFREAQDIVQRGVSCVREAGVIIALANRHEEPPDFTRRRATYTD